jgi:hypothetical protein
MPSLLKMIEDLVATSESNRALRDRATKMLQRCIKRHERGSVRKREFAMAESQRGVCCVRRAHVCCVHPSVSQPCNRIHAETRII